MLSIIGRYWDHVATVYIKPYHDEILTIATAFIAIYTIVLACQVWRQVRDGRIINRAYLSVRPNGIKTFVDDPTKLVGYIAIKNVGHLIAKEVTYSITMDWNDTSELTDFPPPEFAKSKTVIFPEAAFVLGTEAIDATRTGGPDRPKGFLYVWGTVSYKDGFFRWKFWRKRETKFCHYYFCGHREVPTIDNPSFRIAAQEGRDCGYGNDAT